MKAGYMTLTSKTGWNKDPPNTKKTVCIIGSGKSIDISNMVCQLLVHISGQET